MLRPVLTCDPVSWDQERGYRPPRLHSKYTADQPPVAKTFCLQSRKSRKNANVFNERHFPDSELKLLETSHALPKTTEEQTRTASLNLQSAGDWLISPPPKRSAQWNFLARADGLMPVA